MSATKNQFDWNFEWAVDAASVECMPMQFSTSAPPSIWWATEEWPQVRNLALQTKANALFKLDEMADSTNNSWTCGGNGENVWRKQTEFIDFVCVRDTEPFHRFQHTTSGFNSHANFKAKRTKSQNYRHLTFEIDPEAFNKSSLLLELPETDKNLLKSFKSPPIASTAIVLTHCRPMKHSSNEHCGCDNRKFKVVAQCVVYFYTTEFYI